MSWKVIDKLQNDKVIESHARIFDAQRALHILTAHELKNGRKAHYAIDPPVIEACPPTLDELKLPSWAYNILKPSDSPTKEPSDGERRAALRNPNYEQMSARDQWEEDKALGILDWDGD